MFKTQSRTARTARGVSSGPRLLMGRALLVVGGLLIGLLLAETTATCWRMAKHGSAQRGVLIQRRKSQKRTVGEAYTFESELVLHPLFGYTFNPKHPGVNNFGFKTDYDFSLSDGRYVIKHQTE